MVGVLASWPVAAGPAVIVGVVGSLATWSSASGAILRSLGARRGDESRWPRPFGIVEGLCATMGLSVPELWVVDDPAADALVVGTSPARAALVLTTGLLDLLDPVQLEAVLAHELSHVKSGDVAVGTVAAALALPVAGMGGAADLVHRIRGHGAELLTDRRAVGVTRYPPALSAALVAMAATIDAPPKAGALPAGVRATAAGRATGWLWTVALGPSPTGDALVGELDVPEVRIAALDEL